VLVLCAWASRAKASNEEEGTLAGKGKE